MEVLPHLFLGNCENSKDIDCLREHGIKHIVNVTQDVPNMFERDDVNIRYLRIPIKDHWSENLSDFFYKAIVFIGELSFSLHNTHTTHYAATCNTLRCNMQHTTLRCNMQITIVQYTLIRNTTVRCNEKATLMVDV